MDPDTQTNSDTDYELYLEELLPCLVLLSCSKIVNDIICSFCIKYSILFSFADIFWFISSFDIINLERDVLGNRYSKEEAKFKRQREEIEIKHAER